MTPPSDGVIEAEETGPRSADNSLGRLLTLSDGVFAIALTLLALDLHVPSLPAHTTDAALRHALAKQSSSYLSFLISFYVVGSYWARHRRLMRSAKQVDPDLIRTTMFLLLCVAALPFPAALLGTYASHAITLVVYGGLNAIAVCALLRLHHLVRSRDLGDPPDRKEVVQLLVTLVVFLLLIPAGYVFPGNGAWVFLLLIVVQPADVLWRRAATRFS